MLRFLFRLVLPLGRYVWFALRMPHVLSNDLFHIREDVKEIKRDVKDVIREQAHQRGICEQTRRELGLYE